MPVCLSIVLFLFTLFLRAIKWTYILKIKEQVSWRNGYHTIMISNMVNFILPVRFGEILKLYVINKVSGTSYSTSVSSTLVDKFSHLLIAMILLLFTPAAGFRFSQWSGKYVIFLALFVVLLALLFLFGIRCLEILKKGVSSLASSVGIGQRKVEALSKNKFTFFLGETLEKANISEFSKGNIFIIVLTSFIILSLDGACNYFIIRAFGINITWLQGILAACFFNLMFILPTPPVQIGTAEMYPVFIFSWGLGLPSGVISSTAVLWHLLTTLVLLLLGVCSLIFLGVGPRTLNKNIREKGAEAKS